MAMYYQGNTEIESDGAQTLYLMNPNYDNMVLMNPHAPPLPQFVGVPLSHDSIPRWGLSDQQGLSLSLSARQTDYPAPLSLTSKYLKAAQELLEEVANVGKDQTSGRSEASKVVRDTVFTNNGETGNKVGSHDHLTTPQRQEIQMKKAKLNSMLDEVEQRHRQYQSQMQAVVALFEQAAGSGSARTYTQLALKTILKQFKVLKSTICAQIKGLNQNLGEEESVEKRLKLVDNEVRRQRAMQQLGMMQNNAWRPQRGLPERAVSVLRAWLFEHFLHPYPKDSDKQMLAKQTGLTRSQVSNWFINARVRLWKPMVEEMYQEETNNINQHQINHNSSKLVPDRELPSNSINAPQQNSTKTDPSPAEISSTSLQSQTNFAQLITSENHLKRPRNTSSSTMEIKARERNKELINSIKFTSTDHGQTTQNYLSMAATNINTYGIDRFNNFQGNNFSLTLGLPPTQTSHNFLSHRNFEFGTRIESGGLESDRVNQAYEVLDFQNRKPHQTQLLPDFVA